MKRFLKFSRFLFPLVLGAWGAQIELLHGKTQTAPLICAFLLGTGLGWLVFLLFCLVTLLLGYDEGIPTNMSNTELEDLRSNKLHLLGAIYDVEFDVEMGKLTKEEAAPIIAPLRESARKILKEIDQTLAKSGPPLDQEIEKELKRLALETEGQT